MADKDILMEEREAFEAAHEAEAENRKVALEMVKFVRLSEQWPADVKRQRELEGRPTLTINKMNAFIRQVVNDGRMNRPQIKVKGVDEKADPHTAKVIEGLVRNIEYVSKADVAYDTALENAATMGWGYLRLAIDYEYDDTFDKGLRIKRVANPFSVYADPHSTEADSSDWNQAHVVEYLSKSEFKRKYKGAETVDWTASGYDGLKSPWQGDDDDVLVCEAWRREIVKRKILLMSDGNVVGEREYAQAKDLFDAMGISVVNSRDANSYKITQRIMTGAEVLEENEWAGQYIPVIPIYGEEINVEGKRHWRGLVHDAVDAQRMFNYWRTNATEMVALAPKVPFIGEEGSFDVDGNWDTANTKSHPYLMYKKGSQPPMRQPLDPGQSIGAMSEAMAASDDMKAIIGMYDASLGARSNETSGVAISARKKEGDVASFHFIDNLSRGIRHLGCCIIDLIPKVYNKERIIRILGEDGQESPIRIGEGKSEEDTNPMARVFDLSLGKYDVAVDTGPSFTTRREEMAVQMTEFVRSFPAAAPIIGDLLVKALDWQNSEEIAERLKAMMPQQAQGGMPPELEKMIGEGKAQIAALTEQTKTLEGQIEAAKLDSKAKDVEVKTLRAELHIKGVMDTQTKQMQAMQASMMPHEPVAQQSPVSVNVPENIGQSVAEAIVPAVTQAVTQAISQIPPLQVQMPRMKRTPVRDPSGLIMHTVDEPMIDEVIN